MKVTCEHCGRYLFTAVTTTIIQEMPCGGCGAKSNHKIIFSDDHTPRQLAMICDAVETEPKRLKGVENGKGVKQQLTE